MMISHCQMKKSMEKDSCTRRLFFSTIFPEQLQIFCAWQEKATLNQTGSEWFQYIPLARGAQTHEDIGYMMVFLCSKYADHITGQIIYVDGEQQQLKRLDKKRNFCII